MKHRHKIELLAPAKNADYGIEAILHGADAVYIGAPMYGARASVSNNIDDIARLARFAHQYHARVYVAMNTILEDKDLTQANRLIHELYEAGADAIIIQDMGILQLSLPPIALHASTQMDNRTADKAMFLEQAGFSQIVLARELTIGEIAEIASKVTVPLEVFVHGALCVSYSGQCYLSNVLTGRSANRGTCSQPCRLPYNIVDSEGRIVVKNKYALSMKDLNLIEHLEALMDVGVRSFKIEGRLKDLSYLKNTVSLYRSRIDEILSYRTEYKRASVGQSKVDFTPDLQKTFNRGFTNYFLYGRKENVWSVDTPKSIGEEVGFVLDIASKHIILSLKTALNNGDGLCFFNCIGELEGIHINRVEGNRIFPLSMPNIKKGTKVFRNNDYTFEKLLSKKTAERRIASFIDIYDISEGFRLVITDEAGYSYELTHIIEKELAQKEQTNNIVANLSKTGQTIFAVTDVRLHLSHNWFIPASLLSRWRRQLTEGLLNERLKNHPREEVHHTSTTHAFPEPKLNYLGNVANSKARTFYSQHHTEVLQPAFELKPQTDVPLMFTRHCIKYSMGWCPREEQKANNQYKEPFFLTHASTRLRLEFDCKVCEMRVYKV